MVHLLSKHPSHIKNETNFLKLNRNPMQLHVWMEYFKKSWFKVLLIHESIVNFAKKKKRKKKKRKIKNHLIKVKRNSWFFRHKYFFSYSTLFNLWNTSWKLKPYELSNFDLSKLLRIYYWKRIYYWVMQLPKNHK